MREKYPPPLFSYSATGITLDKAAGTFNEAGKLLIIGFNGGSPQNGDAVVATFYWLGSTNIIDSVADVMTTAPFTRVGNTYHLVQYVTADGLSMATYVATGIQGIPAGSDPPNPVYAVGAWLRDSVADGGVALSAFSGVEDVFEQAIGTAQTEPRSASGTGMGETVASAGGIGSNWGAVVYTTSAATLPANVGTDPAFTRTHAGSDAFIRGDAAYVVAASGGGFDPQWTWFFDQTTHTWVVTSLTLNPARSPNSISLDRTGGSFNENGNLLIIGFNSGSPHTGDAVVATFYWLGSTNIIDSVADVRTTAPYTHLGNPYHLVQYVTAGGLSMATYVATNVQGFPDNSGFPVYAVGAWLRESVTDGGVALSAFSGVEGDFALALGTGAGAPRSASGTGTGQTVASAGSIAYNAGALVYTTSAATLPGNVGSDPAFTHTHAGGDTFIRGDAAYAVPSTSGSADPQWTWFFDQTAHTWLVNSVTLNAAPPAPVPAAQR